MNTWAVPGTINDKKISVILNTTHMVRFTFHVFRRSFVGCDPVVASKALERAASKPPKPAAKKQARVQLEKAFKPKKVTFKRWLQAASSGSDVAPSNFVFGGPVPAGVKYSWN